MAIRRWKKKNEARKELNPEAAERQRLKRLAFSNGVISEIPAKASRRLNPSNTVLKHLGKDIVKKSQRRNKYLFSFPGHIAPIGRGGKIGDLKNLGTKNPVLYVDFPQGQMKLFGTILYPKNGYLTLQFSRDGRNALCEDYFDTMILFSDAWWIGRKDENPEETRLDFPKEMYEGQQADYEFAGGAGSASAATQRAAKNKMQHAKEHPETPENYMSKSEDILEDAKEVVPVHHSDRPSGKTYKFAEISSGLDSPDVSVLKKEVEAKTATQKENPYALAVDLGHDNALRGTRDLRKNRKYASGSKCKKLLECSLMAPSEEVLFRNRASLVQSTISTLFRKVEQEAENDDDIEEFSSTSKETDGSDEDWTH
ncbi:DNA-binding protein RHL1-like [Neltuma alba]|uniref:DNA-binding protein RHL1-like n=1 Tax=Neltuma alba TaxID=207710 RepID=UPI0010A44A12|nr:DNA-binding protein RHL1-like [Prosopis alba]XP_028805571.1 DNA-binding protein RHL1-like [Prosopis alba]